MDVTHLSLASSAASRPARIPTGPGLRDLALRWLRPDAGAPLRVVRRGRLADLTPDLAAFVSSIFTSGSYRGLLAAKLALVFSSELSINTPSNIHWPASIVPRPRYHLLHRPPSGA